MPGMRKRLARVGNSWGLIVPKEVLDLLGIDDEVDLEIVGSTMVVSAPDLDENELEASLAYLASKRERSEVYRRLAQ
jgi:antitoxin component of MazEF toxin-antitoxin module